MAAQVRFSVDRFPLLLPVEIRLGNHIANIDKAILGAVRKVQWSHFMMPAVCAKPRNVTSSLSKGSVALAVKPPAGLC